MTARGLLIEGQAGGREATRGHAFRRALPLLLAALVIAGVAAYNAALTVAWHREAARSAQTQAAPTVTGKLDDVEYKEHRGFFANSFEAVDLVHLEHTVGGRTFTLVHSHGAGPHTGGAPVRVRLNPADPRYAEYAGVPYRGEGDWIRSLIAALTAGLAAMVAAGFGRRRWRRTAGFAQQRSNRIIGRRERRRRDRPSHR